MAVNETGTLGQRFLVIIFGSALVLLGLYSNNGKLFDTIGYIKKETTAYARGLRSAPRRTSIDPPHVRKVRPSVRNDRVRARLATKSSTKHLDSIRRKDREQLNKLLNDL